MGKRGVLKNYQNLVLYDSDCLMCSGIVNLVLRWDTKHRLNFIGLNSKLGISTKDQYGVPDSIDTIIFIGSGKVFIKSEAVLELVRLLAFPLKTLVILYVFPKSWRDNIYEFFSRNRLRWFGKTVVCEISRKLSDPRILS